MGGYEILLLKEEGTVASVSCEFHLTDTTAIYSAHKVAKGKPFEVWRGSERIYPAATLCGQAGGREG